MRHNELRNTTASFLCIVAKDVAVEPGLQPLTGEQLRHRTAIRDDGVRLDVAASGVRGSQFERTFFDVWVFNPQCCLKLGSVPALHIRTTYEGEKRRCYEERVREVERASFVPLVFSATGGTGKAPSTFLKRLVCMMSEKKNEPHSIVMAHVRSVFAFGLVRSAVASLRGYRRPNSQFSDAAASQPHWLLLNVSCRYNFLPSCSVYPVRLYKFFSSLSFFLL